MPGPSRLSGEGLRIARVLGIPIYLHPTWFIMLLLVTLTLAASLARDAPHYGVIARWVAAGSTALLFFLSILLHELGHSALALRHRVPVRSITLFVFGGVAMMERDPDSPRAEFQIAAAGPAVSALLALFFVALGAFVEAASTDALMFRWLATINFTVAAFNVLPGFPLDGGRLLRALLWSRGRSFHAATRIAAGVGRALAYGLIGLGAVWVLLWGNVVGGVWLVFIGWFLLSASDAGLRRARLEHSLEGLRARDLMSPELAWIDPGASVEVFTRDFAMRGRRWALAGEPGALRGIVTISDAARVKAEDWARTAVGSIATPPAELVSAEPEAAAREVLAAMSDRGVNQVPVLEGARVVGAVTREALIGAIRVRGGGADADLL